MAWLKDNWFKLSVLLLLLMPLLSLSYYYSIHKPRYDEAVRAAREAEEQTERRRRYEADLFDKKIECQGLYDDLARRFGNVRAVRYSEISNTCMVSYFKDGEIEEGPFDDFGRAE